jgi:aminopeptidase N
MRKIFLTILPAIMALPFFAHAQTPFPGEDVQHYTFNLKLNDDNDVIKGKAEVTIKFTANVPEVQLNLVKKNAKGKGMEVGRVTENGKDVRFEQDSDVLHILAPQKLKSIRTFIINYEGIPADGLIIAKNHYGHRTFFGDNWPNRAHNWIPCADYPSDKASLDFIVTAPDHYQVVANGLKVEEKQFDDHLKLTHWKETLNLPTKVMVIGVAEFAIDQSGTVNGVPVYTYVFPESKVAGFKSYAYAPDILAWYEQNIGPYAYKMLANVESKTIYGGMVNSSAIFYYEGSPFSGKRMEELEAHEIAHQWFGDQASETAWKNLWLSEGFATYITNCYLEHKYGHDTLTKREFSDRRKALRFERQRLAPVIDSTQTYLPDLIDANSYEKGGWVLHMLRHKVGDTVFWQGIRAYYAKYNGSNASTDDLREIMEKVSGQDLKQFFHQWLRVPGHPDLAVVWHYDADKKALNLTVTQKQSYLYTLQMEYSIDGTVHTLDIKDRETTVAIPLAVMTDSLLVDPNVTLYATFTTKVQ